MGFYRGAKIITDGLIFGYDADDKCRFYKGEPTINLQNTNLSRTLTTWSATSTFSEAPEKGEGWKKVIITSHSTNFRLVKFPYTTIPNSSSYTFSVEYDFGTTSGYYFTVDGSINYSNGVDNGKKWQKTVSNTNGYNLSIFLNNNTLNVSGLNDIIYYRYYQVEQKTHATQFTSDTRSVTDGLIDFKKTSIIDLTNMSYDSSANIVFDGVSNYINVSNTSILNNVGSGDFTISMWVKRTTLPPSGNGEMIFQNSNTSDGIVIGVTDTYLRIELRDKNTSNATAFVININFTANIWNYITLVKSTDTLNAYCQGVYKGSGSTYSDISTTAGYVVIGGVNWWSPGYWEGKINIVHVHNKALTPTEIMQNFNAQKNRFGL